ncbi:hypothetical protein B0H66DRAFT_595235 [Apodospora peruviana]|uniref:Uncharacterized protein n=1 Tax=Apodospora peruviana TaxID=516989 RepID=A0AAE0HTQ9_9PEZI|nr:hypothetical protein B0H66DRAFT_595235 [Apodospora peruviana]
MPIAALNRATMRRLMLASTIILQLLVTQVAGQDAATKDEDPNHGVVFIYPTKDQIYNLMDTVNVTYTSPFPTPNLYAFCDGGGRQVTMQRAPGYNATVPYVLNFTSATPCWFNLRPGTLPGFGANSESFTIIGQERGSGSRVFGPDSTPSASPPPFTTGSSTSSSSSTGTGTADQASQTAPGQSPASQTGDPKSGLSTGAAAGIGVSAAIVVMGLVVGAFMWSRKRKRMDERIGSGTSPGTSYTSPATMADVPVPPYGGQQQQQYDGMYYKPPAEQPPLSGSTYANSPTPAGEYQYSELNAVNGPAEMAAMSPRTGGQAHEMPG